LTFIFTIILCFFNKHIFENLQSELSKPTLFDIIYMDNPNTKSTNKQVKRNHITSVLAMDGLCSISMKINMNTAFLHR
jgi:hypothetical protein